MGTVAELAVSLRSDLERYTHRLPVGLLRRECSRVPLITPPRSPPRITSLALMPNRPWLASFCVSAACAAAAMPYPRPVAEALSWADAARWEDFTAGIGRRVCVQAATKQRHSTRQYSWGMWGAQGGSGGKRGSCGAASCTL